MGSALIFRAERRVERSRHRRQPAGAQSRCSISRWSRL